MDHVYAGRGRGYGGEDVGAKLAQCVLNASRDNYAQFPEPQYNIEELVRQVLVHDVEPGCLCISTEQKALTGIGHTILTEMDSRRHVYYRMRDTIAALQSELQALYARTSEEAKELRNIRDSFRERYYAESRTNAHYRSNVDDLTTILNGPESDRMLVKDVVREVATRMASQAISDEEVQRAATWLDENRVEEEPAPDKGVPEDVEAPVQAT